MSESMANFKIQFFLLNIGSLSQLFTPFWFSAVIFLSGD